MLSIFSPLSHQVLHLIVDDRISTQHKNSMNRYLMLNLTLFFSKYKSAILDDLYYKGLVDLHGDVTHFIRAKTLQDIWYLKLGASITVKGMAYYQLNLQKAKNAVKNKLTTATQEENVVNEIGNMIRVL